MKSFNESATIKFNNIQGLSTLIEKKRSDLDALVLTHMDEIDCRGPLTYHKLDVLRNDMHVKSGLFDVSISSVSKFLMGMAS